MDTVNPESYHTTFRKSEFNPDPCLTRRYGMGQGIEGQAAVRAEQLVRSIFVERFEQPPAPLELEGSRI